MEDVEMSVSGADIAETRSTLQPAHQPQPRRNQSATYSFQAGYATDRRQAPDRPEIGWLRTNPPIQIPSSNDITVGSRREAARAHVNRPMAMTICAFTYEGMTMRVSMVAAAVLMMFANAADAGQDVQLELGAAAGVANALHGDLGFAGPAASGTARVRVSPHVAIEAEVGYWQHTERKHFLTPREPVDTSTRYRFPGVLLSVMAVSNTDARIGPYGGAGVGVFYQLKRYEQSGTTGFPAYARSDFRVSLGGGFVGGVDVRVARRLKTFGEVRFDIQSFQDPGASSVRVLGGVRVPIG